MTKVDGSVRVIRPQSHNNERAEIMPISMFLIPIFRTSTYVMWAAIAVNFILVFVIIPVLDKKRKGGSPWWLIPIIALTTIIMIICIIIMVWDNFFR